MVGGPEWDGTLSAKEFRAASFHLAQVWENLCSDSPPWRWQVWSQSRFATPDTAGGYLVLEDVLVEHAQDSQEWSCYDGDFTNQDTEKEDGPVDSAMAPPISTNVHFYTYHVIYSEVFRVPKLFLKGRFPDGRPLQWEDIQQDLPPEFANENTKWTFLTHEEHPYLHLPWFSLHPCGTSSLMSIIFSQWMVGQTSATNSISPETMGALCMQKSNSAFKNNDDKVLNNPQLLADDGHASVAILQYYLLTWLSFASQAAGLKLPTGFSKCFTKIKTMFC